MALAGIQRLIKEVQASQLRERRAVDRKPFVRPVQITTEKSPDEPEQGFSRDISLHGIGVIGKTEWRDSSIATLVIHSLDGRNVTVKAEVRWCKPYGNGWYLTGWSFLGEVF